MSSIPSLTDDDLKRLGMPQVGVGSGQPVPTGIPSLGPTSIPSLAVPTKQQSQAAGKTEFKNSIPSITAPPLTDANFQQQEARNQYEKMHPWGSDVSAHPGAWGKLGHVAGEIGQVAGASLFPSIVASIPGTQLNRQQQSSQNLRGFNAATEDESKQAATKKAEADIPLEQAETAHQRAAADALEDPAAKPQSDQGIAALAKLGLKKDASGNVVPMEESEITPELRQARGLQGASEDLKKAQIELANSKNDPNSAAYKLEQAKVDEARERTMQAAQALGLHQSELTNKIQEQGLVKPSGQTQSRAGAANAVLQVMPKLESLVKKNGASMGPLMGRLESGEISIGDVPPDVAELYAAMKSFYALQPAVHGFRNAEFVKDFSTAIGTLERDPAAFLAGMQGLKPTIDAVAKEGVTYRHRIVEPAGSTAQQEPSGPPHGATHIGTDKSGKDHYLDAQGKDLGIVNAGR